MSDEPEDDSYIEVDATIEFDPELRWSEECPVCGAKELYFFEVEPGNVLVLDCRSCGAVVRFTPIGGRPLPLDAIVGFDEERERYRFN